MNHREQSSQLGRRIHPMDTRTQTEIDRLLTWSSIYSYYLPFVFFIMALMIVLFTISSMMTEERIDTSSFVFRLLCFIPISAGVLLVRNLGKNQKKRAVALRKELMASLQIPPRELTARISTPANESLAGEISRLFRIVFLGRMPTRRILAVLILCCAAVTVVWAFMFFLVWGLDAALVLILFLPMVCLLSFLLVLYRMAE